jgi:hypothetical protein
MAKFTGVAALSKRGFVTNEGAPHEIFEPLYPKSLFRCWSEWRMGLSAASGAPKKVGQFFKLSRLQIAALLFSVDCRHQVGQFEKLSHYHWPTVTLARKGNGA